MTTSGASKSLTSSSSRFFLKSRTLSSSKRRSSFRRRYRKTSGQIECSTKKTFTSFQELIDESEIPVLVDFYATWCGPCKLASEMCGKFASQAEFKDKVKFVKIDTEKYVELSSKWKVEGLPTFVLFHKGKVLDRIEGLPTEQQMKDRLLYFLQQV